MLLCGRFCRAIRVSNYCPQGNTILNLGKLNQICYRVRINKVQLLCLHLVRHSYSKCCNLCCNLSSRWSSVHSMMTEYFDHSFLLYNFTIYQHNEISLSESVQRMSFSLFTKSECVYLCFERSISSKTQCWQTKNCFREKKAVAYEMLTSAECLVWNFCYKDHAYSYPRGWHLSDIMGA